MDPVRGLSIVETEVSTLTMAMKRGQLWSRSTDSLHPALLQPFVEVKRVLAAATDLNQVDPNEFLSPFLDVIRSESVTGPVTGLALSAVNKFLAYGLLDPKVGHMGSAVENLADAVTHARFVGVDPSSDEVVLMKIMEVLRTLMLSPVGLILTNESVCEIMQSMFRICFESRLTELLRKTAEHALADMIQVLFSRLPTFSEEFLPLLKRLKMRSSHGQGGEGGRSSGGSAGRKKYARHKPRAKEGGGTNKQAKDDAASASVSTSTVSAETGRAGTGSTSELDADIEPRTKTETSEASNTERPDDTAVASSPLATAQAKFNVDADVLARSPMGSVADLSSVQSELEAGGDEPNSLNADAESASASAACCDGDDAATAAAVSITVTSPKGSERAETAGGHIEQDQSSSSVQPEQAAEFTNAQGVTFTPTADTVDEATGSLIPYGLPCVRELFRFLISLINVHDAHNQDSMIQIALSLLSTALETGARHLDKFESMLMLVKDDLARSLVGLLSAERIGTFSSALWVSYMMFESQRDHLKFQLEIFFTRLIDVVCSESQRVTYEHKELALEMIVRFYRIPGFLTQLYLNFDCGMYTSNIFEDLTKMLSKNAFPVTGLYSTHFLSLDALLTVVESIETQCQKRMGGYEGKAAAAASTRNPALPLESFEGKRPAASGFQFGLENAPLAAADLASDTKGKVDTSSTPTHEDVMALKHKKKLIKTSTEQFNAKPSKGIAYMQECGLIKSPLDNAELAVFMRENPHLDKKQLGEFISNRKNLSVLEAFVQSFDFVGLRVDESLRQFLEAFRLPGEAPLITLVLEHFADHWQRSNGDPFADSDAAFTLSYAVIMLNVDQHNKNHTKVNEPMTQEQFMRNLRGTNGGADHDPEMLGEIYHAIKSEEIVMPAEQTGLVKENYLWKCVLKRGSADEDAESQFLMAPDGYFDHDLFAIVWGPAVAALSYVFDKSQDAVMVERALNGFQRCSMIAAHYHMSDVFDNLVISLCKFTTLLTVSGDQPASHFVPVFGMNTKAMLATRTVFSLVQKHGDILRDGWRNVAECLLQLFKCDLLPQSLMTSEDFLSPEGRVRLLREDRLSSQAALASRQQDNGFLTSFMSFVSMGSDSQQKTRTPEEEEAAKLAQKCIDDCHLEWLITESKFLHADSLLELINFLVTSGSGEKDGGGDSGEEEGDEHEILFYEELLVRITGQNLDRVSAFWPRVSAHISALIHKYTSKEKHLLLERSVTALLRLAVRLSRKPDLASMVVQALRTLLSMKVNLLFGVCRQIAFGLHEMLRNNAANIHDETDWVIIFALIEVVGAGANPAASSGGNESDGLSPSRNASPASRERSDSFSSGGWIVLGSEREAASERQHGGGASAEPASGDADEVCFSLKSLIHSRPIVMHDAMSFFKCCESLEFLIRDVAHITPHNLPACVQAVRTFVEASFVGRQDGHHLQQQHGNAAAAAGRKSGGGGGGGAWRSQTKRTPQGRAPPMRRAQSAPHNFENDDADFDSEKENVGPAAADLSSEYHHATLQLVKLMHSLHTGVGKIYSSWAEAETCSDDCDRETKTNANLWNVAWCPLLQGMARMCCDKRSHIRTYSLTKLQSSLLYKDLSVLTSTEWENAFVAVLFPMLGHLLVKSNPGEKTAMEETRMRAATLLCKVFLQHLAPLTDLVTFRPLWLTILDFMEKFIEAATSDLLADAVPESLKNMLLVMDTAGLFFTEAGTGTVLHAVTERKLQPFLPNLMSEVFRHRQEEPPPPMPPPPQPPQSAEPVEDAAKVGHDPAAAAAAAAASLQPAPSNEPSSPAADPPPVMPSSVFFNSESTRPPPAASSGFALGPPPPLPSSTIINCSTAVSVGGAPAPPTTVVLPAMPEIAPMPPPPPGVLQSGEAAAAATGGNAAFQPIHVAHPTVTPIPVPVANPKPQMPQPPGMASSNILTAAFTPAVLPRNPVVYQPQTTDGGEQRQEGN